MKQHAKDAAVVIAILIIGVGFVKVTDDHQAMSVLLLALSVAIFWLGRMIQRGERSLASDALEIARQANEIADAAVTRSEARRARLQAIKELPDRWDADNSIDQKARGVERRCAKELRAILAEPPDVALFMEDPP